MCIHILNKLKKVMENLKAIKAGKKLLETGIQFLNKTNLPI